jgi:hypothetical protein
MRIFLLPLLFCARVEAATVEFDPAPIYDRTKAEFASADFFKPIETGSEDLAFKMAPLILQEVKPAKDAITTRDLFGSLSVSNGLLGLDVSRPAIYFEADAARIHDRDYARFTYLWCYSVEPAGAPGLALQGVRLTLNLSGQPVVWEVLSDPSGAELIFVSESLEAAARAEFGGPLPGRRFAIERSQGDASRIVVPRILVDGPVPMGPTVYLAGGNRSATTVLCRCMPAQARTLLTTHPYHLEPLSLTGAYALPAQARARAKFPTAFWPGDPRDAARLERCLRLPRGF